ncbi:acyltransferase GLAUCE-like [Magnolia sinica]|uniref:acyltransferase GLAUCE-like n=1 Tax=Magnolia sinica TaxID=86752 RepID=UPI00265A8260|nr:acyltransferase GLAUCE-like [Magnolia sinica]
MEESVTLISPKNPIPIETVFLSNIDQTVAFPVETVFFFETLASVPKSDIVERVKASVSVFLLVPYYFMAGRLNFNLESNRLELVCNNAGVPFVGATSMLRLKDLGNVSLPNPSFQHLILRTDLFKSLKEIPLFTIQVTRFKCGGFSIGFVINHSILDGKSAAEMFQNLASICRGEGLKTHVLNNDRTCIKARIPPQIKYPHKEYIKLTEITNIPSSFTSANQPSPPQSLLNVSHNHNHKLFHFTPEMITTLKNKAMIKCSTFEAMVAHLWKSRTRAVFEDPCGVSSVLFAVDIRSKITPPLPHGFVGNAVVTACASAKVVDLNKESLGFCVEKVKEAIEMVTDEYVKSVVDWLEVYRGVPSTLDGNFYVSAWWKLPFHELDFGYGRPTYGGPVVSGMNEFVLLLSDGIEVRRGGGVNVWMALEQEKMEKFMMHVFEM